MSPTTAGDHDGPAATPAATASSSLPSEDANHMNNSSRLNEKPNTNNNEPEEWQIQRDDWKTQGDEAFRQGDYETACRHYSQALSLDPTHAVLLSNRSASYLKANHKSKALQDAQACVQHAPPEFCVKAHSRLAAALWSLGRWQAAKDEYEKMIQLDANNQVAKDGVERCNQQLEKTKVVLPPTQDEHNNNSNNTDKDKDKDATNEMKTSQENVGDGGGDDNDDKEEEDDLLNGFFEEVEATVKPSVVVDEEPASTPKPTSISNQKRDLGTAHDQIERLLQPSYQWRNLNPYWVLELPHTATDEEISQRYKALSLLLHPDKCRNEGERAQLAYDEIQAAKTVLLTNPDKARHVRQLIEQGMKQGKRDYYQDQQQQQQHSKSKASATPLLRTMEEYQSIAVQKILAQVEQKRRDVERRKREYEQRERQQEDEEVAKEKASHQFDQAWRQEDRIEGRVGNWRDFSSTAAAAAPKKKHKSKR